MMRKTITRTITTTTINAFINELVDGTPIPTKLEPLVVTGKVSKKDALKVLEETYGKDNDYTIASMETSEDVYEIDVNVFLNHATKVTKKFDDEN